MKSKEAVREALQALLHPQKVRELKARLENSETPSKTDVETLLAANVAAYHILEEAFHADRRAEPV